MPRHGVSTHAAIIHPSTASRAVVMALSLLVSVPCQADDDAKARSESKKGAQQSPRDESTDGDGKRRTDRGEARGKKTARDGKATPDGKATRHGKATPDGKATREGKTGRDGKATREDKTGRGLEGKPNPRAAGEPSTASGDRQIRQPSEQTPPPRAAPNAPGLQTVQVSNQPVGPEKDRPDDVSPVARVRGTRDGLEASDLPDSNAGPRASTETDEERALRMRVMKRLSAHGDLSSAAKLISIQVDGKRAILRGQVPTVTEMLQVVRVTRSTPGIVDVDSQLKARNQPSRERTR